MVKIDKLLISLLLTLSTGWAHSQVFLSEDFESGQKPEGWINENVFGDEPWRYRNGGHSPNDSNWDVPADETDITRNPQSAYEGSYNAIFFKQSPNFETTKLVTPELNVAGSSSLQLSFYLCQITWNFGGSPGTDELRIYYKTSAEGDWILLQEYTDQVLEWEYQQISLPDPSETYYVAFEGRTRWGYGTCIDNVIIEETGSTPMYIGDLDIEQPFPNYTPSGAVNVPMMRMDFNVFGNTDSVQLHEIHLTSRNSADNDIPDNGVKLYFTQSQTFNTDQPLGTPTLFSSGDASFTGIGKTLPTGHSYVWATYDVDLAATHGNILDLMIEENGIVTSTGSYPSSDQEPSGYREIYETLFSEDFEGSHDWDISGEFEVAAPDGSGGNPGNPNPESAFSGNMSLGTDLSGLGANPYAYEPGLSESTADLATSPVVEALYYKNLNLFYQRYINMEWADSANIQISNDNGATWNTFWTKGDNHLADYQWSQEQILIPDQYARTNQLQLRFRLGPTNGFGNYSGWHIDDVFLTGEFISKDVGVSEWIAPLSGSGHTDSEEVSVRINNYGGADIVDPVPVAYSFDGGANWTINQMDTDIPVGGSVIFNFTTRADLTEPGLRSPVLAKTFMPGDQYTDNDQFSTEIYLVPTYTPPYTEDLEENNGYWRSGSTGIWQHGMPEKTTITQAWSGVNCWTTSLTASYGNVMSQSGHVIFEDDFESSGGWEFTEEFERDIPSWDHIPYNAHGNSLYCIGTDLSAQGSQPYMYENGISETNTNTATTPPIDVSLYSNINVNFYSWLEIFAGDSVRLEASADNGSTWHTLWKNEEGEIMDWQFEYMEFQIPDELSYTDALRIRFSLFHSSASGSVGAGWNIDDFQLTGELFENSPILLTSPSFDLRGLVKPVFTARLWVDTEENVDGATLEYSLDEGDSWTSINNASGYDEYWNWYTGKPVSALGSNGWSGQSGGWINVSHLLPSALLNQSRVQFRLKFRADKSDNHYDGIALDDIRIMEAPPNLDMLSLDSPVSTCELPANQVFTLQMKNAGLAPLQTGDTLRIAYHIDRDGDIQSAEEDYVLTESWPAGMTKSISLSEPFDLSHSGDYLAQIYYRSDHPYFYSPLSNDTLEQVILVKKPAVDLGEDISSTRPDTVLLDASSGVAGQTYLWQDGSTGSTFNVLTEGSYHVRVSNSLGCTAYDTIAVLQLVPDVGISACVGPLSDCDLGNNMPLEVLVENLGTDTIESGQTIYVGGVINAGTAFEDPVLLTQAFRPGESFNHTYSQRFDFSSPGDYQMKLFTRLDLDQQAGNDTLDNTLLVYGYPDAYLGPDTVVQAVEYLLEPGKGYSSYLWQDNSTGESFMVSEPGPGQYYVTISDEHQCISSDTVLLTLEVADLALDQLLSPATSCELSNSITVSARVRNTGNISIPSGETIQIGYRINGGTLTMETSTLDKDLLPGHKLDFTFSSSESVVTGLWYDFEVFVDFHADIDQSNDTIISSVGIFEPPPLDLGEPYQSVIGFEHTLDAGPGFLSYLWQDGSAEQTYSITTPGVGEYHVTIADDNGCQAYDTVTIMLIVPDLGIDEILHPLTTCRLTSSEQVEVSVRNYGNTSLPAGEEFSIAYSINGAEEVSEIVTLAEDLGNGAVLHYTFDQEEDFSMPGSYDIMAYTSYATDLVPSNDLELVSINHQGSPEIQIGEGNDTLLIYEPVTLEVTPGYTSYLWQDGSIGEDYPIIDPSASWYKVLVTGENGCATADSIYVAYDRPDLAVSAIIAPVSSCSQKETGEVSLEILNNGYYRISPEDTITVTYSVNGASSVIEQLHLENDLLLGEKLIYTFTEGYDFSSPDSYQFQASLIYKPDQNYSNNLLTETIDIWESPVVEIGSEEDHLVAELPFTLDAGAGFSSYLWQDNSTSSTMQVTEYGLYWVTVTNEHGCFDSDTVNVVSQTSSADVALATGKVQIYPNPVQDILYVSLDLDIKKQLTLELYSITKALVYRKDIKRAMVSEAQIDTGKLVPGTYFLRVITDETPHSFLVIVE